jgi:AcrR family transcriptional regulator
MQIPKDKIERKILAAAREEFAGSGFQPASMRKIADKAGVSVSNIYNYFGNKDELFVSIVKPAISEIDKYFDDRELGHDYGNPEKWSLEYHFLMLEKLADFIDANRQILKMIAFSAHGSSLQDYRESLIERYTRVCMECMKKAEQLYPGLKTDISLFFAHNIASFWMNIILEILMHDIPRGKMVEFLKEIMKFMFYGYEGLTEYDFSRMKPKPLGE